MHARIALLASLFLAWVGVACALAEDAPKRNYVEPTEADIAIDNTFFFHLRTPAAGFKVVAREQLINERLVEIFSCHKPGPVTISAIRDKPTIYVDGVKLVTVYPRDVEANGGGTMLGIAEIWAANLRAGLPKVMPGQHPNGPNKPCSPEKCPE